MKHVEHAVEPFEQVLLSHVEMCYAVALALTRNPNRAQDLARCALTQAWRHRESPDGKKDIKRKLLKTVREVFLQHYGHVPGAHRNQASLAESTCPVLPTAQDGVA